MIRAHDEDKAALAELRELVNGIHPRVLTDRGLPAAVNELGAGSALPVRTDVTLPCRFERGVETCAYYTISEAVTNANKHSRGTLVRVTGGFDGHRIHIEVSDDGRGGADPVSGGACKGWRIGPRRSAAGSGSPAHQADRRCCASTSRAGRWCPAPTTRPAPEHAGRVAEDSVLLREGLRHILAEFGHDVVAGVGDATSLLDAVQAHRPDLVITDVRMPPGFSDEGLVAAVCASTRHDPHRTIVRPVPNPSEPRCTSPNRPCQRYR